MVLQHLAQRHLFHVIVERHPVNDTIFGINDTRHGDRDGGETLQLLLVMNKEPIDKRGDSHLKRQLGFQLQRQLLFHHQLAAEIAQCKVDFTPADAQREVVPGFGFHHQPHRRTAAAARLLNFRLLHQMRFEHFSYDLGDTGRCQLRKAGKIDARDRPKLINQAIYRTRIGLLNLIDMPRLTISNHHVLPYFRASK